MNARDQIRDFVISNFYVADPDQLDDSTSFLDRGIVDSTGVLEIVSFLESSFGITVEDQEMLPENLDSVGNLAAFVEKKRGQLAV